MCRNGGTDKEKGMKERDLIFFRPLWRRVAATAFCVLWSIVEWVTGNPFWGMVSAGIAAYCYWALFVNFDGGETKDS